MNTVLMQTLRLSLYSIAFLLFCISILKRLYNLPFFSGFNQKYCKFFFFKHAKLERVTKFGMRARGNANLGTRKKSFEKARGHAAREEEMKERGHASRKGLFCRGSYAVKPFVNSTVCCGALALETRSYPSSLSLVTPARQYSSKKFRQMSENKIWVFPQTTRTNSPKFK